MNSIYSQVVNPNQEFSIVGGLRSHGERIRILILGAFGFIGTNILKFIDDYLSGQYEVVVFDRTNKHPKGVEINSISKVYTGDITSTLDIENIFRNEAEFDVVLHLVTTTVPAASNDYKYDIETNLISTIQLLEMCKKYKAHKIIYLSSGGAIYGDMADTHSENQVAKPISSYGITKLAVENYMYLYKRLFDLDYLIVRLSNPYGPYHYSTKQGVINIAIQKALRGEKLSIWGDGTGCKDYIYIEDFCRILFILINMNYKNEIVNIGSGAVYSLNDIVETIHKQLPSFGWEYTCCHQSDVVDFTLDISKLLSIIGDVRFVALAEGISKTLAWHKDNKFVL